MVTSEESRLARAHLFYYSSMQSLNHLTQLENKCNPFRSCPELDSAPQYPIAAGAGGLHTYRLLCASTKISMSIGKAKEGYFMLTYSSSLTRPALSCIIHEPIVPK